MPKIDRRTLLSGCALVLMLVLLSVLAVLQYRWIGQISEAEQRKLQENLRNSLADLSRDFDASVNARLSQLVPSESEVSSLGRERAYESHYNSWKQSGGNPRIFTAVALAWNEGGRSQLRVLDPGTGAFARSHWPASWESMKEWVESRANPSEFGPGPRLRAELNLIDMPRFAHGDGEQDWLLLEIDPFATAATTLPVLLSRHLGARYASDYRVQVTSRADPSLVVFHTDTSIETMDMPDAAVNLFDGRGPGPREARGGKRPKAKDGGTPPPGGSPRGGPENGGPGRWQLSVKMRNGSLESIVAQARRRNLAVSGGILALLLITVLALVRFTRQSQRLADMQMEFVAGVSHELRTPLTVIRTAAYNLRGKLSGSPKQVEQYGSLIQRECEKLTVIIEQVMEFSRTSGGNVLRERQPVGVEQLVEESLESSRGALEQGACSVEKDVKAGLPPIMGDIVALRQAVQNLITNAAKYGGSWIGIRARGLATASGPSIEIRVSDHGPGIPAEEQRHIFDAFFRGKRAVENQVHGTGLGLSLVKRIVEAHGGTVGVLSEPGAGTTFVLTIPAAEAAENGSANKE